MSDYAAQSKVLPEVQAFARYKLGLIGGRFSRTASSILYGKRNTTILEETVLAGKGLGGAWNNFKGDQVIVAKTH